MADKIHDTENLHTERFVRKKNRADKFTWTPADIKVQDENGNWIRGDEFLERMKENHGDDRK